MGMLEDLRETFTREEQRRVSGLHATSEDVTPYREALHQLLAGRRARAGAFVSSVEAQVDVPPSVVTDSVVIEIVKIDNTDDRFEVLVVGDPEDRLDVYLIGTCTRCEHRVPLAPAVDHDSPDYSAGLALTADTPADLHDCPARP